MEGTMLFCPKTKRAPLLSLGLQSTILVLPVWGCWVCSAMSSTYWQCWLHLWLYHYAILSCTWSCVSQLISASLVFLYSVTQSCGSWSVSHLNTWGENGPSTPPVITTLRIGVCKRPPILPNSQGNGYCKPYIACLPEPFIPISSRNSVKWLAGSKPQF